MKVNVALSGINNTDNPGSGIPVIRSLRADPNLEVHTIGLTYENMDPGIYLREYVDKAYTLPLPSLGTDSLLQRLAYIHEREKIDVIIPNFDSELLGFIRIQEVLHEMGIQTFLPTTEQLEARSKINLYEFGLKHHFKSPKTKAIFSLDAISELRHEFDFPMVVKGKFNEAYIAYTFEQVHSYYHKICAKWGLPVLIQQFVLGHECNVAAMGDGKGGTVGAVPMKKLVLTDKGKAWAGVSIDDEEIVDMTKVVIAETNWRGGMEMEIMRTPQNELFVLEINPRFPAWIYFATACGHNMPSALVQMALGKEVKPFGAHKIGKLFSRYSLDNICDISDFEKISTLGEL